MRTDTIFYQLFLTFNSLLFELLGQPIDNAEGYQFISAEVKEKAFRFDGIFMPKILDKLIYFVEVQFQKKAEFYGQFLSEILLYLNQYQPSQDWRAVAIFAKRSLESNNLTTFQQELISSGRILRIYLDELPQQDSIAIGLIQLITSKDEEAPNLVKTLLSKAQLDLTNLAFQRNVIELLESVLVSKFPKLNRQEIEAMFALSDLKQTRVYQEALEEGKQEGEARGEAKGRQQGEARLALRLLTRKLGNLPPATQNTIQQLPTEQIENLGEALLDFASIIDLDRWLVEN